MSSKIALVTGANRGIGFETCRQLAKTGFTVILTSRDHRKGTEAAEKLTKEGYNIFFHRLDVADPDSVTTTRRYVEDEIGRLDVLVNNAAVYLDEGQSIFDISTGVMEETLNINLMGPFHLCRAMIPLMEKNKYGRVVNVSSGYGSITDMKGRTGAYRISKAALNAFTRIVADEVNSRFIKVNTMCPGWVRTGMGGRFATRSPKKATETILWLANLPKDGPTGGFFRDKKLIPW